MKFSIPQEKLTKLLQISSRAISSKPHLPILTCILLEVKNGAIKLQSTNLEVGITQIEKVNVEKQGKAAFPARVFLEFVSSLPPGKVDVETKEKGGFLELQRFKARIALGDPEEYPIVPTSDKKTDLVLDSKSFVKAASKVVIAAAVEGGRPVLTGVLFDLGGGMLKMVATDGYRLSFYQLSVDSKLSNKMIIPAKSLTEVLKIASEASDKRGKIEVIFAKDQNQIIFKVGEVEIVSRLIDGEFPDWGKIIPKEFQTKTVTNNEEFLKAVKIASIFARDSSNVVKCKVEKKSLVLSANTKEVGDNVSEVDSRVEGVGGEIAFNYRYLLDVLLALEGGEVGFEMIGPLNPGRFTAGNDNNQDFFHIVMPVRVQS